MRLKQTVMEEKEKKDAAKRQKTAATEVDEAATEVKSEEKKFSQQGIRTSMQSSTAVDIDEALAELFFGCNIAPAVIEHPLYETGGGVKYPV